MRGSIRQFSMLKVKKTLIEILNGLWNKNKARRIFLEAGLHLPTPASADGRGSWVSTPSISSCHTAPEIYTRLSAAATKKRELWNARDWLKQVAYPDQSIPEKSPLKTPRTLVPLLQTKNLFVLQKCHPGAPGVAWWQYPVVYEKNRGETCPQDFNSSLLCPSLILVKDMSSPTKLPGLDFLLESQMVAAAQRHQH